MASDLEGLDIFLSPKGYLLKDEGFDILGTESWNLDNDKFLESIRFGDKLDNGELIEETEPDVTDAFEIIDVGSPEVTYTFSEDLRSPSSASSSVCSSSPSHSQSENNYEEQSVKVVQLVGILPPGCKTFQIVNQDDDETVSSEETMEVSSTPSSHVHHNYQELKLSEEEKRLLIKEGVTLPSHYPLTKFEERELKRIRRKIRNKISAQDSRKRKKEFLDTLQQRVHEIEEEKSVLCRKVRTLEIANSKLVATVKRLQAMVANASRAAASAAGNHSGTSHPPNPNNAVPVATLLVLMLSLAIVVLPTMQGKKQTSTSIENGSMASFDDPNPNTSMIGRHMKSRTMIGFERSEEEAEWKAMMEMNTVDVDEPLIKIPRFSFHQSSTVGKRIPNSAVSYTPGHQTKRRAYPPQGYGSARKRPLKHIDQLTEEID